MDDLRSSYGFLNYEVEDLANIAEATDLDEIRSAALNAAQFAGTIAGYGDYAEAARLAWSTKTAYEAHMIEWRAIIDAHTTARAAARS